MASNTKVKERTVKNKGLELPSLKMEIDMRESLRTIRRREKAFIFLLMVKSMKDNLDMTTNMDQGYSTKIEVIMKDSIKRGNATEREFTLGMMEHGKKKSGFILKSQF